MAFLLPLSVHGYDPFNCWSLVMERVGYNIPAAKIIPNTNDPEVGDIAIFDYDGIPHYAYIKEKLLSDWRRIEECNLPYLYGKGRCGTRNISPDTPHFVGYYDVVN